MSHPLLRTLATLSIAAAGCAYTAQQGAVQDMARQALARIEGDTTVPGVGAVVRVIRDEWGVPHIYAESDTDLFFAQGYVAAQDRLWQMEIWRRTAEGRLAEVLGPDALPRDRVARLLKYRGPADDGELQIYHPDARRLMTAFVGGVNAYNAGVTLAAQLKDNGTRELMEKILIESEEHVDWLETQLNLIKELGLENYLTEQMGSAE